MYLFASPAKQLMFLSPPLSPSGSLTCLWSLLLEASVWSGWQRPEGAFVLGPFWGVGVNCYS